MDNKNKTDQYAEHINNHILPFIDYPKLQASYNTDMSYAKGILNLMHEALVSVYGSEQLDENTVDDGFVVVPGVLCSKDSGNLCLALFQLDLSSSGEHWGTDYLCKYGLIPQDGGGKVYNNDKELKAQVKEMNLMYLPYNYCYTAVIPCDIHINKSLLPEKLKSILNDFRNHRAELVFGSDETQ